MPQQIKKISEGAELVFVENNSFTTSLVSVNFYLPLKKETVAKNALLPELITSCSQKYPDYLSLNYHLSSLYGADVFSSVLKVGDCLCIKFAVSAINNRYAFSGEKVIEDSVKLLLDLIFRPNVKDGAFLESDLKREKRKLIDRIKGDINEKRIYARNRLVSEMFEEDSYGLYRLGKAEDVEKITGEELFNAWKEMLSTAYIRIHCIGESLPETLKESFANELKSVERKDITDICRLTPLKERNTVKRVTEKMDVAQGKLVMGFSCVDGNDDTSLPLMVMTDLFGSGPYSRLFTNVREKMSLCYYCSASSVRNKGFMMVDCGVEKENCQKAEEAILKELQIVKNGEFTDFEFASSVKSIKDSLKSYHDSQNGLDQWYTIKAVNGNLYTPDEISEKIDGVTRQEIIDAAQSVKYNTVYMLLPKGEE